MKMADRQTNYQAQRARALRNRNLGIAVAGSGAVLSATFSGIGMASRNPYRGNPDVQKYMGLEKRADSLRDNLASTRHPMVKPYAKPEAVTAMENELKGAESTMAELGAIPNVLRYEGWSQNTNMSGPALGGLVALLCGLVLAKKGSDALYRLEPRVNTDASE